MTTFLKIRVLLIGTLPAGAVPRIAQINLGRLHECSYLVKTNLETDGSRLVVMPKEPLTNQIGWQ